MYPYNRNTQLYHCLAKEAPTQERTLLAKDKRLEELLSLANEEAMQTAQKTETLLHSAELAEAENLLKTMYLDGKKHLRLLQELCFSIFGTAPQSKEAPAASTADTCTLLEELLCEEMDDISFYRDLLFAMPTGELQHPFWEIITDKQNHATALSHLYAKYFR